MYIMSHTFTLLPHSCKRRINHNFSAATTYPIKLQHVGFEPHTSTLQPPSDNTYTIDASTIHYLVFQKFFTNRKQTLRNSFKIYFLLGKNLRKPPLKKKLLFAFCFLLPQIPPKKIHQINTLYNFSPANSGSFFCKILSG